MINDKNKLQAARGTRRNQGIHWTRMFRCPIIWLLLTLLPSGAFTAYLKYLAFKDDDFWAWAVDGKQRRVGHRLRRHLRLKKSLSKATLKVEYLTSPTEKSVV